MEFDDDAVQMSITLGFDPAGGSEPSSNHWTPTPGDIDTGKHEFLDVPFVQTLVDIPARTLAIAVFHCG